MFLALIIPAFLSPCFSHVYSEQVDGENYSVFSNASYVSTYSPSIARLHKKIKLAQLGDPFLKTVISPSDFQSYKNETGNYLLFDFKSRGPARMPRITSSKHYGISSHYRMKSTRPKKKSMYRSLIEKILKPKSTLQSRKQYSSGSESSSSNKYQPEAQPMSSALSSPGWSGGGGWGWKGGGGGHHGYGLSLTDLLLCGLGLLSLGGFLLNLLLNLANLLGYGLFTTTSTYPVTTTQTGTATSTATGGGGAGGGITTTGGTSVTLPTGLAASALSGGWGTSSRTISSVDTGGWGWKGNQAKLSLNIKLPMKTTTTTTPLPTLTGTATGTGPAEGLTQGLVTNLLGLGLRQKRPKRETFQPYVNPSTALDILAKSILNSINSATNQYDCMEKILCENNKKARVVGQWLDYFMPVYSLSLIGHRMGTHESLGDHIRAIVLGVAETNCQTHYPRCGQTKTDLSDSTTK